MKIAIVDIETTGFSAQKDNIVEIGITSLDLKTGERELIYNKLVREQGFDESKQRSWVFLNTDLKFEDVMNADPLELVELQEIFNKYPTTAYNKKFDFLFLKERGFIINELPCPMLASVNVCKILKKSGKGYKWPKVQEVWDFLFPDSDYIETHRGGDDSLHEAEIVYELFKLGQFLSDVNLSE